MPVYGNMPCGRVEVAPVVQVSVGKSTVLKPSSPIARVLLGNPVGSRAGRPVEAANAKDEAQEASGNENSKTRPGVAEVDVLLLSPSEVYVLGRSIGTTNVVLLDQAGRCTAFDVVVGMDTAGLQTVISQLLPNESEVRVSAAFDAVVLSGTVSDNGAISRILELANAYVRSSGSSASNPRVINLLSTGAAQQVMLEVKVAEVSKSLLDRWGINFSRAFVTGDNSAIRFLSGLLGGTAASGGQIRGVGTPTIPVPFDNIDARSVTNIGLDAQKTDGLVKVLAEPSVLAISGQKGSFNAGGKIFIPVAQDSGSGGRTVTLEEKPFGVSVSFLPTVLDGGRIDLAVATEVSELNREGVGISAPGVSGLAVLPSFTSRSAKTTVQLQDGQSFAIGGLIKNNVTTNIRAFPFLGELPIIGALFRSSEFQTDKSELVFVITPRLVKPLTQVTLPTDNYNEPTRGDVHFRGKLEGKRRSGGQKVSEGKEDADAPDIAGADGYQVK
ncbi:type II and III secretion system protein family protein [Caldimonas tepidiphila]|uniref:type II and III secretion system protein family protein n=1 Tax=Caldimonas tepidiphila TaxID=2315841 RepID=UPI001F0BEE09|nr:pilus assembly protein N-terminal domain-containing protein [Caldimonas tepidiphila]